MISGLVLIYYHELKDTSHIIVLSKKLHMSDVTALRNITV